MDRNRVADGTGAAGAANDPIDLAFQVGIGAQHIDGIPAQVGGYVPGEQGQTETEQT